MRRAARSGAYPRAGGIVATLALALTLDLGLTFAPALTFALALSLPGSARAEPDARAQAEIDHLLGSIAASGCTFIRAGKAYSATEAREHLQGKYRQVRSRLATADEFIVHVASASSMTGEPYRVRCGATESDTGPWLRSALERYRGRR